MPSPPRARMMPPEAGGTDPGKSVRASQPCAHCQAEDQALYVLPRTHRDEHRGSDVCSFCYLRLTHEQPGPAVLLL